MQRNKPILCVNVDSMCFKFKSDAHPCKHYVIIHYNDNTISKQIMPVDLILEKYKKYLNNCDIDHIMNA